MSVVEMSDTRISTFDEALQRAREVAVLVREDAEESERLACATPRVIEAFRDTELFWVFVPREYGGAGLRWTEGLKICEEIAAADGSMGWMFMANSIATAMGSIIFPNLNEPDYAEHGRLPLGCGTLKPIAKAVEVDGGLRVGGGPIPFNSAFQGADYVLVFAVVQDASGQDVMLSPDVPDIRGCRIPKQQVEDVGNWDVLGMAATGSVDIIVPEQFVPQSHTRPLIEVMAAEGEVWEGEYLDLTSQPASGHGPVALGLARHALEEIAALTRGKVRLTYPGPVDEHPIFLHEFSKFEAMYWAARDYFYKTVDEAVTAVETTGRLSVLQRDRIRQAITYAHYVASEVVDFATLWGGTQTFRNPSVLGRVARDMITARNHVVPDPVSLTNAGPSLLGAWRTQS